MTDRETEIDDYLRRYAQSLASFDAEASAALWSTPGTIVDDRFSGVLDSRDDMARGLEQSYPVYRQLGLAGVDHEVLDARWLTDALVLVHVRWVFRDEDGEILTDSHPYYLLRREEDGLRTCVCVQTDDLEKLQALAADRGVEMPGA